MRTIDVEVLMSYYNGDRYIREQIQSILDQTYSGMIKILIRDDGSTKTELRKILDEIPCPENRQIELIREENVGPQRSFLRLIQLADQAEYYFYADQDDVWLEDKIQNAVQKMQEKQTDVKLYCSNYKITDSDLQVICESGVTIRENTFQFLTALLFNTFPGCVMGMNAGLLNLLKKMNVKNCMMHDSYTFGTALAVGEVYYDARPEILHRIHQNNVVGYGFKKIKPGKWIREKFSLLIHKEDYDLSEYADSLLQMYGEDRLSFSQDVRLLRDFKKSPVRTWQLLRHPALKHKLDREAASIYCKILFHLF